MSIKQKKINQRPRKDFSNTERSSRKKPLFHDSKFFRLIIPMIFLVLSILTSYSRFTGFLILGEEAQVSNVMSLVFLLLGLVSLFFVLRNR